MTSDARDAEDLLLSDEPENSGPLLEAQGMCRGCGDRYLFLSSAENRPGDTTETNEYCQCDDPHENVITLVYDPDLYTLVDNYGDGDIGLRATCEGCGYDYYGPVTECPDPDCESTEFNRWMEGDDGR